MSSEDGREAPDDGNWVTVGARPRQKAAPPPSAPAPTSAAGRKKRPDPAATGRRPEPRDGHQGDWQLVMRSRQALTKLRDEDFALTRLGQIHSVEPRKANPRPANRSRLGAKFPTSMASDRPNRPAPAPRRPARLLMPKFDVPLRSETDFPSLRGKAEPAAAPPAATTERRRSSVALKLDESLRSMAGAAAAANQTEPTATPTAPMPPPPAIRSPAYSEALSWRARPARKSERRDQVRGEIREDVAMLQTDSTQTSAPKTPPASADPSTTGPATPSTDSPPKKNKEKEKRMLKKAKKKESELILARLNASKDTHVQLVTADAFERLHGAHGGRWRRSQAEAVDLRADDQYPSLASAAAAVSAPSYAAAASAAAAAAVAASVDSSEETAKQLGPSESGPRQGIRPPDKKGGGGAKTYSRMLRELPKSLPPPTDVKELVEAKEAKRKAPKKRAPIETSIMDLAARTSAQRTRRVAADDESAPSKPPIRRPVQTTRLIGNRLDSSVLVHKRGKERLKKKKPSLLKRVILKERAERRRRLGLESGAAALLAGLTVRDKGEMKSEAGDVTQTAEREGLPAAEPVKIDVAPASEVKQGGAQLASPQKPIVLLKREPVSPAAAAQKQTPETKPASSAPISPQQAAVKTKEDPSSTSPRNTATEAKPAVGSGQNVTAKIKQEPISPAKSANNSVLDAAQKPSAEIKQEAVLGEVDEKPVVTSPSAPVGDAKDSEPTDGADSDEDAPPSRGPSYTPCVTVDPKVLIHSRKFREYCQQTLSSDIDESARLLLQDLTRFQDRLYNRDPIKARARRRLVFGLREVSKHLAIKKLACVILAPNIEKIETAGGLDQAVQKLLTLASEREVPLVFALKRRALGHACKKPVPVSCVGIFNYQGSEDNYKRLMQLTEAAQERYRAMVAEVERALQPREERSQAEQLLGVIDDISRQRPVPEVREDVSDDPTQALLVKLRSVTLGSPVSG